MAGIPILPRCKVLVNEALVDEDPRWAMIWIRDVPGPVIHNGHVSPKKNWDKISKMCGCLFGGEAEKLSSVSTNIDRND